MNKPVLMITFIFMTLFGLSSITQAQYVQIADIGAYQFHQRILSINSLANKGDNENVSISSLKKIASDATYDKYVIHLNDNSIAGNNAKPVIIGLQVNKAGYISEIIILSQRGTSGARGIGYACKRILFSLGLSVDEYMSFVNQSKNNYINVWCHSTNRRINIERTVMKGLLACTLKATDI